MKNNDDRRLLDHKRMVDEQRKSAAVARQRQAFLRDTTPGTATPLSVFFGKRKS